MSISKKLLFLFVVILLTFSTVAMAQNQRLRITGTVLDEESGEPLAGVKVVAYMRGKPSIKVERVSDDEGNFKITGLQAGAAVFELMKDGYKPSATSHRIDSMKATQKVVFRLEKIERASGSVTEDIKGDYDKAAALFKEGKNEEALNIYKKLINDFPDLHQIHVNIGFVYSAQKEYDNAIEHFLASLRKDPENAQTMIFLGDSYLAKADKEKALEWYIKAEKIKSDFWITNQIADVARTMNSYILSKDFYLKAIEHDPGQPLPHLYIGTFLALDNKHNESIKHTYRYIQLDSGKMALSIAKNLIKESLYKADGAEAFFRKLIAGEKPEPLAHYFLGMVLAKAGSEKEAAECFKKYLELDPSDEWQAGAKAKEFLKALS